MDGMDGLVGGFSLLVFLLIFSLAYMYHSDTLMILTAALAGSTLGFLRFNAFPARIFLGDTGSLALGFFLVVSAVFLTLSINQGVLDLTFPIILFGVPVIDTLKVMALRIVHGRHPFLPDKTHLHHVIFGSNVKHKTTVFIIHSFTLLFLMTAFYYVKTSEKFSILVFILFSIILLSIKPLMALLKDSLIHKVYAFERDNMPTFIMNFYRKYYVSISIFFLSILFIFLIPGSTRIGHQVILFFILALLVMLVISVYQNLQSKLFSEIYVLINAAIFFGVTNLSYPLISTFSINQQVITLVVRISFVSLAILISFFILTRERLVKLKGSFLTAIDLIFLLMISLLVIVQSFIKSPQMNFIGANLILGFVAYLSYKIVSYFNNRFSKFLFYLSFVIPLFSLIFIYFS